jgi:hypothetical protein
VKFDVAYPYGEKHDQYTKLSQAQIMYHVYSERQSQHRIVVSMDPDMATVDSSLNLTLLTVAKCPRYFRTACPVDTSQRMTVLSIPQETIWLQC